VGIFGFEHGASRRYAELAVRLFGVEAADAPLPPGIILEMDRPEWARIKGETLFTAAVTVAGANFATAQIFNPVGSGMLAVINYRSVMRAIPPGAADLALFGATAAAIAAGGGISASDSRDPGYLTSGAIPLLIQAASLAASPVGPLHAQVAYVAGGIAVYRVPQIIGPGFGVWSESGTAAVSCIFSFAGYVRRALPEELKF